MQPKPEYLSEQHATAFQDASVAATYALRPSYPRATFDFLTALIQDGPHHVLDVGCGIGYLARPLVEHVERVDAVDFSQAMLDYGQSLPHGDDPRLRWIQGRAEDVPLDPPYALIMAGESLHWMDWYQVLPRFASLLTPHGSLAIVNLGIEPHPFANELREVIDRYTTNRDFQGYDMVSELERRNLFKPLGEQITDFISITQSIEEYVESYHARSGFARARMTPEQAAAFDHEATDVLQKSHPDGLITFRVRGIVSWGQPLGNPT
jgi:ubiquinone/menaquinone biosynthesis C-methylase UbiE